MRPPCSLFPLCLAAVVFAAAPAPADDLDFIASRACLSPGALTLTDFALRAGDAYITADEATLDEHGPRSASGFSVRPCGCVPLGLSARQVRLLGDSALVLDGVRWFVGYVSLPLAPRWWVVWGQRVGALLPRVEVQGGYLAIGPGVHLPLGNSLAVDTWVLARIDGASLENEFHGNAGTLRTVALGSTHGGWSGTALGALAWNTDGAVTSVRADGSTTDAAGNALARTPAEALRAGSDVALGTSIGHDAVAAASIELGRRGDDVGVRTMLALAAPTLVAGGTVLSARAYGAQWIDGGATALGDFAMGLTSRVTLGPLDVLGYARTELYGSHGTIQTWTGLARAGLRAGMSLHRRYGGVVHRLQWSVGAGAEEGTVTTRSVAEARASSDFRGTAWRWTLALGARASTGTGLPPRAEAHTELDVSGLALTGGVIGDAVLAEALGTAGWVDARGDRLSVGWIHRQRSAWDLVPLWDHPESGPLDLEGVRAYRRTGETARASGAMVVGPMALRAEAAVDGLNGDLVLAGGALRWQARCGCAWVEAGGFRVRGNDLVAMLSAQIGRH